MMKKKVISALLAVMITASSAAAAPHGGGGGHPGGGPGGPIVRPMPGARGPGGQHPGGPAFDPAMGMGKTDPRHRLIRPAGGPAVKPLHGPGGPGGGQHPGGPVIRPSQGPGGSGGPRPGGSGMKPSHGPGGGMRPGGGPGGHGPGPGPHPGPGPRPGPGPHPGPRPTPRPGWYGGWGYYRHGDYYWDSPWVGGLIGLLIGAIINGQAQAQPESTPQSSYTAEEKVITAAKNLADAEAERTVKLIEQNGVEQTLHELNSYWQEQRQPTFLDERTPVSSLRVSGFQHYLTMTYEVDRSNNKVTVYVESPYYNVSEKKSAHYSDPARAHPQQRYAKRPIGFTVSDSARAQDGSFIVQSVDPATAAAYAGLKEGCVIKRVDGNSTAQVSAEQMETYIIRRSHEGVPVKITFTHNGKEQTVPVRP